MYSAFPDIPDLPLDCTSRARQVSALHSPSCSTREEEEVGMVPDFPPALQVLLDHLHDSPFVQVHLILVSCGIRVNNGVLLLCWDESTVSWGFCFMETWTQSNNS